MRAFQKYLIPPLVWFLAFWISIGWQVFPFVPSQFIEPAQAADPDMIIFMDWADLAVVPPGWEVISDTALGSFSDVFYNRYVRGGGTYGAQSGTATHTHSLTYVGEGLGSLDMTADNKSSGVVEASAAHSHGGLANQSITSNNNLPAYQSLAVLRYSSGIPSTLPDNTILLFETATISGNWELYSAQDAYFLRGSNSTTTGGDSNPTHTVASGLSGSSGTVETGSGSTSYATNGHTHSAGSGVATDGPSIEPPYYEVVFQRATAAISSFPNNMIAGFSGTAFDSAGWTVVSNTSQKYDSLFLKGDSSGVLTSGGTSTHSHTTPIAVTSGDVVSTGSNMDNWPDRVRAANASHTHSISINLETNINHIPLYTDLVLAQYASPDTLDVTAPASVTLNSGNPGTTTADYTFTAGELVTVADGTSSAWSLTVSSTALTANGDTIPASNVYLKTDGVRTTEPTLITPDDSNVTETNYPSGTSLDSAKGISDGNTSADGSYDHRPTFFVVIPPYVPASDYSGTFTFTVA